MKSTKFNLCENYNLQGICFRTYTGLTLFYCFLLPIDTRRQAILALGAIARRLRKDYPELSLEIVNYLHTHLNTITPSQDDHVLIDSIGNAGHESSRNILHTFVKNDSRITVQHAAIRALRYHHDSKVLCISMQKFVARLGYFINIQKYFSVTMHVHDQIRQLLMLVKIE